MAGLVHCSAAAWWIRSSLDLLVAPPLGIRSTAAGAASAPAAAEPRLRALGDINFLTAPPDRYRRGGILYVLDAKPLHNTTRLRIGRVQVSSPSDNTVT